MSINAVREAWASDRAALGCFSGGPSVSAENLARAGFDFVVLDAQHGGATMDSLVGLVQGVELGGAAALVRVPWNDPAMIMRALDVGAAGVIVPMVSTAEEARVAASACRYPPAGIRSFGQHRGGFGGIEAANRGVLCIPMIETAEGVRNVEEIVSVPGVDATFIGPIDLSLSLGLGADLTLSSPEYIAAIEAIADASKRHGCVSGVFVFGSERVGDAMDRGFRFIAIPAEGPQAARREVELFRALLQRQRP